MNEIYVVGMGPGEEKQMTIEAREVLESCDVIVGYTVYAELMKKMLPEKTYLTTPMRQEAERCRFRTNRFYRLMCCCPPVYRTLAALRSELYLRCFCCLTRL